MRKTLEVIVRKYCAICQKFDESGGDYMLAEFPEEQLKVRIGTPIAWFKIWGGFICNDCVGPLKSERYES